jgi:uncharacterized phage protein gp47/JayE
MHSLYGYADWIMAQMFPDTCDESELPRFATLLKVPRKDAAYATGATGLTFATAIGAVIDTAMVVRALDGVEYSPTGSTTATTSSTVMAAQAVLPAAAGNRVAGQSGLLTQPRAGVQSSVSIGDMSGGADVESVDAWRARIVEAWRNPAAGGTEEDYIRWAKEVPGVTRAWCYPLEMGLGSVVVRFVRDDESPITPDAGEVATMQAYLDTKRPLGPPDDGINGVVAVAPTLSAQVFTIHISPDTPAIRAAIAAELADLMLREGFPGTTLEPCTILLSHIREAVSQAAGEVDSVVSVPSADIVLTSGNLPTAGTITWV